MKVWLGNKVVGLVWIGTDVAGCGEWFVSNTFSVVLAEGEKGSSVIRSWYVGLYPILVATKFCLGCGLKKDWENIFNYWGCRGRHCSWSEDQSLNPSSSGHPIALPSKVLQLLAFGDLVPKFCWGVHFFHRLFHQVHGSGGLQVLLIIQVHISPDALGSTPSWWWCSQGGRCRSKRGVESRQGVASVQCINVSSNCPGW